MTATSLDIKKRKYSGASSATCTDLLDLDLLSTVFQFLHWEEILKARCVCQKWKQAAQLTCMPLNWSYDKFGWKKYNVLEVPREDATVLNWIGAALPRLPGIRLDKLLVAAGQDPEEEEIRIEHDPCYLDLNILKNFRNLQFLSLTRLDLNGRYPFLFQFQSLQILNVSYNPNMKWDLEDVGRGLPNLERLKAARNPFLTGNLSSLRTLRHKLVSLILFGSSNITGSIHNLADFPVLEEVNVTETAIEGDLSRLGPNDFLAIQSWCLGENVRGSKDIPRISDAARLMQSLYPMKKRKSNLFLFHRWTLQDDSLDYYNRNYPQRNNINFRPPFWIEFLQAGPRVGWRWTNAARFGACLPNWLDPEPQPQEEGYDEYLKMAKLYESQVEIYRGFTAPPTAAQHDELVMNLVSGHAWP